MAHAFFFPLQTMPLGRDNKQYYQERRLQHPIQSLSQLGLNCATFVYQSIVYVYGTHNSLLKNLSPSPDELSDKHSLTSIRVS